MINFPSNPSASDVFVYGDVVYVFDGVKWVPESLSVDISFFTSDITVVGGVFPSSDLAFDLGSSDARWRDLYLSGNTLVLGDTSLSSSADGIVVSQDGVPAKIEAAEVVVRDGNDRVSLRRHPSTGRMGFFSLNEAGNVASAEVVDLSENSTSQLAEGSNLYFTDSRARAAVSKEFVDGLGVNAATLGGTDVTAFAEAVHTHLSSDVTNFVEATQSVVTKAYVDGLNVDADTLDGNDSSAFVLASEKASANGVASLDANGRIPSAQIPPVALGEVFVVADNTARDALTVQEGDVAKVTGSGLTYIFDGSSWLELSSANAVDSVNGYTGTVSLTTADVSESGSLYFTDARAKSAITKTHVDGLGVDAGTLDGIDSGSFLRSDANDTATGLITFDQNISVGSKVGTWITSSAMADAIGWNNSYGVYIGSNVSGTHYLRGNGTFTTGGNTYNLWHSGNDGSGSGLDADLLDGRDKNNYGATLATYGTTSGASGRIRITAPFNTNSSKMFQVTISLYGSYNIDTYVVGGYMYSSINQWYSPTCVYTGTASPDIIVGRDASGKAYISVANRNYAGVRVHNMTRGYVTSEDDTYGPWTITINGATENSVTPSVYKTWNSGNDGSGSGLDADTVDGVQAGSFVRSDTDSNKTGFLEMQDNAELRFGNDADIRVYFDGSHLYFRNYNHANGNIYFQSEGSGGANKAMIYLIGATPLPYVEIYGAGNKRVSFTSTGSEFGGQLYIPEMIYHAGDTDTYLQFVTNSIRLRAGNETKLYTEALYVSSYSSATSSGTQIWRYYSDTGSSNDLQAAIYGDGDFRNDTGVFASFSDERLKTNIREANSQWEDIKKFRFVNYQLKKDVAFEGEENALVQLGVLSQDVEAAGMGGLVKETLPDPDDEDQTRYKMFKYSIMHTKAVKALQEAIFRIEALEAEVAALKA